MTLRIPREELLKRIGCQDHPHSRLLDIAEDMMEAVATLAETRRGFKEFRNGNNLPPFLEDAALKYAAALTLGPKLEEKVKNLFAQGKAVEAYVLDTAGSVAVSREGDLLWDEIRKDAALKGFGQGLRRCPGCKGIDLQAQRPLFESLEGLDLGITLTEAGMMVPRKSFSFLAGFGGNLQGIPSCTGCKHYTECTLRG